MQRREQVIERVKGWIRQRVSEVVVDDEQRFRLQLIWVFRIVAIIVLVMSVVNLATREFLAILPTFLFGVICIVVTTVLERIPRAKWAALAALAASVAALFVYYIISGEPEGFSPVWICIVPPVALLLAGRRIGGAMCWLMQTLLLVLMWTPWGRGLLQYPYAENFLLRLPLVYAAAFGVSWFLEYVREVTQKKLLQTQRSYQHLYRYDALTGVMNRYGFNEHISRAAMQEHPDGLALMIVDLDDFKQINDRYGHPAGDAVLRSTAQTLQHTLGDLGEVSRWGGEEFAVLLHAHKDALRIADALRSAVAGMLTEADGELIRATVSIGMTVLSGAQSVDAERMVTQTDKALYRAKKGGKNQVVWEQYVPHED